MKDVIKFREYAEDCRRLAKSMKADHQSTLLKIADAWDRSRKRPSRKLTKPNRTEGNRKTRATAGLVGVGLCVQLHQKGEKTVRQVVWQLIEGSKLSADCRLDGAETQGFVPFVVLTALREIEPFLRHFDERRTNSRI
jgi:hypothetical protein